MLTIKKGIRATIISSLNPITNLSAVTKKINWDKSTPNRIFLAPKNLYTSACIISCTGINNKGNKSKPKKRFSPRIFHPGKTTNNKLTV